MNKISKEKVLNHPEYKIVENKVVNYKSGFTFEIPVTKMTKGQYNALSIMLNALTDYIECIAVNLSLEGNIVSETWRRK